MGQAFSEKLVEDSSSDFKAVVKHQSLIMLQAYRFYSAVESVSEEAQVGQDDHFAVVLEEGDEAAEAGEELLELFGC